MPTKDPIKIKEKQQRYYLKNKAKIKERTRLFLLANPEKKTEYNQRAENKRRYDFEGKKRSMFKSIKTRLRFPSYKKKNRKLLFTWQEFKAFIDADKQYPVLFKAWEASGYQKALCPSVDRIDNDGDYSLDNIQIITMRENGLKSNLY